MSIQIQNMERIQEEVNWFTKNLTTAIMMPLGKLKDALLRSIQKLVGYSNLK